MAPPACFKQFFQPIIMTLLIKLTETQITIASIVYVVGWFVLFFYAKRWSRKMNKQIEDDHYKNVNDTLLLSDRLSEEEMAVFNSEFKVFDCYKSGN
jgi:hypothetical protein